MVKIAHRLQSVKSENFLSSPSRYESGKQEGFKLSMVISAGELNNAVKR